MTAREVETRKSRRDRRRNKEGTAAAMIIMAMLMCMSIVIFAIWTAGKSSEHNAVETGGTVTLGVTRTPSNAAVQSGETGSPLQQSEYQQLSDPLLVLVNAEVALPDNWQVTPAFIGEETVDNRIYDDLNAMFLAAQADGVSLWVASGYRSVEDQERILNREIQQHVQYDGMTEEEARELSLRTINPPGHSEHHTGFVVDLNDVSDNFEETEAYQWLSQHAAEYGFVQRYRTDKVEFTGIDNESWHYRYVGKEHAQAMESLDMCLEEYVEYLKNQGETV